MVAEAAKGHSTNMLGRVRRLRASARVQTQWFVTRDDQNHFSDMFDDLLKGEST